MHAHTCATIAFEEVKAAVALGWIDEDARELCNKGLDAILASKGREDELLLLLTADDATAWLSCQ